LRRALAPAAVLLFVAGLFLIYSYGGHILWGVENLIAQHKSLSMPKPENPDVSRSTGAAPAAGPVKEEVKEEVKEVKPSTDKPEISKPKPLPQPLPVAHRSAAPPVVRKVQEGDNLFRLTLSVYGRADDKLVAWVQQNNPWIKDINYIPAGKEIIFPQFSEEQAKAKVKAKE